MNADNITREDMDKAAHMIRGLLAACERIQAEQPARRFLNPAVALEAQRLAANLTAAATSQDDAQAERDAAAYGTHRYSQEHKPARYR